MNKELFIKEIRKYLPFNSYITLKSGNLMHIKKNIFKTDINIHPVFVKGGKTVFSDILTIILNKNTDLTKEAKIRLNDFYHENQNKRKFKVNLKSAFKNINSLYNEVIAAVKNNFNNIDFNPLSISWGRKYTKKRYRSIRFGSFDKRKNLIRINPLLDNDIVPDFFIRSVIYHEIMHFVLHKSDYKDKKHHDRNFYLFLKKADPDFINSKKWQKENLRLFF